MAEEMIRHEASQISLWDLDEESLLEAQEVLSGRGAEIKIVCCDLSRPEEVKAQAAEAGSVDILVNNAGVVSGRSFLELSEAQIERSFRVNALAHFWTVRAFLPGMLERDQGHIVTLSSASGLVGVSKLADYAASKHAAVGFDESLRMELRGLRSKVKTTLVCPYFIDTGLFEGVKSRFPLLLPILRPERVARRVIKAIEREKARLWMPPMVYLIPPLRLLPVSWFDAIAGFLGINASMDEFKGRAALEEQHSPQEER